MKRIVCLFLSICLISTLSACGKKTDASAPDPWQEQFDLGIRYLSEGNYEAAIIAFNAAIEIDPKRPEAYGGLASTYITMGEYEKADAVWKSIPTDISETDPALFSQWQSNSDEIRAALENGENGIWILDCSFDKNTFIEGAETEFDLTVFYSFPENTDHTAVVQANLSAPFIFNHIGDHVFDGGGNGILRLSVSAVPAFFGGIYFALGINVFTGEDRQWLYGDDIYLTPTGELSEYYAPLNAYGGTEFSCRYSYRALDTLDKLTQERVVVLAQAAIDGNKETILSLVKAAGIGGSLYTTWNGYKIQIYDDRQDWYYQEGADRATDRSKNFTIQLRPENGIGYYCDVRVAETTDPARKDSWFDYTTTVIIISCPCVDWQWNGAVSVEEYEESLWRNSEDSTSHAVHMASVNGTMVDGVWEGTAVETTQWSEDRSGTYGDDHHGGTYTTTRVFQNGIPIEENGESWDSVKRPCFIGHYDGHGTAYSDQQSILDERYW